MIYELLADGDSSSVGAGLVVLWILLAVAYFLPTMIAAIRHVPNVGSLVVINLFLGWTFIGWVVALAMAFGSAPSRAVLPRGMQAVTCPRCNAEQNIPVDAPTFECWQCKYAAHQSPGLEKSLDDIWGDHLTGATLSQTRDDLQRWWNRRNRNEP